ncbi:MAG: 30S ribosomal protein S12 methylthiotransferase RimO [Acidobacteria bacterium]|nr:30S ribosomal protein S12 methylthiotransferase RimO [Acidobacteriota bacterium]MCH8971048.1 30S ribosomal protein S12 methylthiotransferase RimO [Acidobacteriota bacterium]TDI39506.1 MAG: 30S ribosomal protein S12 methylthiotransferase RimO [Acidobacteriota bacterium]
MTAPSLWLTTLGCAKNQVDSEKVTAMLSEAGYVWADSPETADVVMTNTCAFIEEARAESVETILDLEDRKREGAQSVVIGCMAQRFGTEVSAALPEVDAVLGIDRYGELVGVLDDLTRWHPVEMRRRPVMDILHATGRPVSDLPYAYLKVAEGCNKPCTFCAIPLIRGKQRSRRPTEIRDELVGLVKSDVSEVVLVAQDLAAYGRDIDAPGGLPDLLTFLSDVDGLHRLRLLYLYPREINDRLLDEMTSNPVVTPYFDLSLQHVSQPLLRAMKRPGNTEKHLALLSRIRGLEPASALRSSFIVGFPGETDDHVDELADFLEIARLDWAGFFPYSAEPGTPAATMENQVPREVALERLRYVSGIQDEVTTAHNEAWLGRIDEVLIDQVEDDVPVGRSYRHAPEIDGVVRVDRGKPGEWVKIEYTGVFGPDMEATVL